MAKFKYKIIGEQSYFGDIFHSILKNRGVEDINSFLGVAYLGNKVQHSAKLFKDIDKAVNLYLKHINNESTIAIPVDPDLDGYTSATETYLLTKAISNALGKKCEVICIQPFGKKRGLSDEMLQEVLKTNCNLVIIPDAGSSDVSQVRFLKDSRNIDTLILDHHDYDNKEIEKLAAIVNNQDGCYPNKHLTGVGVAYKFFEYLLQNHDIPNINIQDYLDLVSVGMIADNAELLDLETRYLVFKGLEQINNKLNKNLLIKKIVEKESYSLGKEVTCDGVSFYIAPLINALTRNGTREDEELVFKAMLNSNELVHTKVRGKGEVDLPIQDEAIRVCDKLRRQQRKLTAEGFSELQKQVEEFHFENMPILVLNGSSLDSTYTGLIANKISGDYRRPCLVIRDNDNAVIGGSGRGYKDSNIENFRQWCNNTGLFVSAKGHDNAFGILINKNNINSLYNHISQLPTTELIYKVDGIYNENTLNKAIVLSIGNHKSVWGKGVEEPLFAVEDIIIPYSRISLNGTKSKNIKFSFNDVEFIKFNSTEDEYLEMVKEGKGIKLTVIGKFDINNYNGVNIPQVKIQDYSFEIVDIETSTNPFGGGAVNNPFAQQSTGGLNPFAAALKNK